MRFEDTMMGSGKKKESTKVWLTIPISLVMHVFLVVSMIVVPLMNADENMPDIKVIDVLMSAPPPPTAPPPPAGKKKSSKAKQTKKREDKPDKPRPVNTGRLVAPVEIPDEIQEEEVSDIDFGADTGIEGGIEGGIDTGNSSALLGLTAGDDDGGNVARVSSIKRPKLIRQVQPVYPPVAMKARIRGTVIVEATTDIYGNVRQARVVSGHPLLQNAALAAVRQWQYEPFFINGVPKPVRFVVNVNFTLQ